ncbi:MAG TPA: formylglycine-generating enzyme family protein, partial [Pirellulales bacterium]|nr:formylglycine-generating enzyme family protein [Pirellulales bacterium]
LRLIPAGKFVMGSPDSDPDHKSYEPQHEVMISKPFYLGSTEVTQLQWQAVMGNNPAVGGANPAKPIENVSWDDCQQFLEKLNKSPLGQRFQFRLPTEAEWEYACRAGTTTAYYFGDDLRALPQYAWFKENSEKTTHPVGQLRPNAWDLYDMSGNVWEWCSDWHAKDYYQQSPPVDPQGAPTGSRRVLRGGAFSNERDHLGSGRRNLYAPDGRSNAYGLRIAATTK